MSSFLWERLWSVALVFQNDITVRYFLLAISNTTLVCELKSSKVFQSFEFDFKWNIYYTLIEIAFSIISFTAQRMLNREEIREWIFSFSFSDAFFWITGKGHFSYGCVLATKERQRSETSFWKANVQSLCGITVENIRASAALKLFATLFLYRKTFKSLNEIALDSIGLFLFNHQCLFLFNDVMFINVNRLKFLWARRKICFA